MTKAFADKATVYFRATPEVEKALISSATKDFKNVIVQDAYLVSGYEGEPVKALTVFSDRQDRRTLFDHFVLGTVSALGRAGLERVLVEINGVGAVYEGGTDYERIVPKETGDSSG